MKRTMYWESINNEISSEFVCETCQDKLKDYQEVSKHAIKFKHYSYLNKDMAGMRLMVC